jgi:hypothetical protein
MLKFILQALLQSSQHIYEKREGSGARYGLGSGSGSAPLTNESGSGRPKNIGIHWLCATLWACGGR